MQKHCFLHFITERPLFKMSKRHGTTAAAAQVNTRMYETHFINKLHHRAMSGIERAE
jgi:hypothetical protein